ncbi:MAG: DUF4270 family protein [Alistipes sp.]|nr:DUF4270 family protein [Candidatus Alistipes equi]
MRICSRFFNISLAILAIPLMALFTSCQATEDGTLGNGFVPVSQKMVIRHLTIKGGEAISFDEINSTENESRYIKQSGTFFQTRQFKTDSLLSSNLMSGYIGIERNDTFGVRYAALAGSIVFMNTLDEDTGFGYKPIFDTMKLALTVTDHGLDTLTPVKYRVYELTKSLVGNVLSEKDSTAYINCDLSSVYDKTKPLFEFTYPDPEKKIGPSQPYVIMTPVDMSENGATWTFLRRLMLIPDSYKSKDWDGYAKDSLGLYEDEQVWLEHFNGIYIEPDMSSVKENARGAIYELELDATGLYLQCRNRNPKDPTLIQDTIGVNYCFRDLAIDNNLSVNKIGHDYKRSMSDSRPALLDKIKMHETLSREERTVMDECFIEGMAGPCVELYFTDDFIDQIKHLVEYTKDELFSKIGVNKCELGLYIKGADYDWVKNQSNWEVITPILDNAIPSLGAYSNVAKLVGIKDYNYTYANDNSVDLAFGGKLDRSLAKYKLDITIFMQSLVSYVISLYDNGEWKEFDENEQERVIYIAPTATAPYVFNRSTIQGGEGTSNAPIHMELTYTIIK